MAINGYKHCDPASSGGGDGSSWATSGSTAAYTEAELETFLEGTVAAGDVIFIKDGTLTADSDVNFFSRSGTATSPIVIIGVKSGTTNTGSSVTYSDWSRVEADMPFYDMGNYQFITGDYTIIRNLNMQGEDFRVLDCNTYCVVENCILNNDHVGSSQFYFALDINDYSCIVNTEVSSTNRGVNINDYNLIAFSYIHDCSDSTYGEGCVVEGFGPEFISNTFDTCLKGISSVNKFGVSVINNTFYETDTGVEETTGVAWRCINNVMEGNNTYGFRWTTQTDQNFFWKNHGDDTRATDMWSNVDTTTIFQDYEVTTGDPKFNSPGTGDFSLQDNTSPLFDDGLGART